MNLKHCPLCERGVPEFEKWRGIYLCKQDIKKFEKIESILKSGQYLNSEQLKEILEQFGQEELKSIESSKTVIIKNKPGRKKRVVKNDEATNIKPPKKRKKKI